MQITEQDIQPALNAGLEYFDQKDVMPIPGKHIEDIAALKGLMRAILAGSVRLQFQPVQTGSSQDDDKDSETGGGQGDTITD